MIVGVAPAAMKEICLPKPLLTLNSQVHFVIA